MVFLHSHGVSTARAVRIFKTYGSDAIQVMTENPYRLARDIRGIGFKTADTIAAKLGIEKTAMVRVRAGISYALTEAMDEGHCGLPTDELVPLAEKLLGVPQQLIRTALELELTDGTVIADWVGETPCVFLAGLYRAERTIAERLKRLANGTLPWPWIDPDKALPWVEKRISLALAESQVAAIRLALMAKVLVMTGGPGVGKTTIVNAILRIFAAKGIRLLLCAPTGRAAKRMTEATGFEAKTIHRLLEVDPRGGGFRRGEDNPLDCDLLVIGLNIELQVVLNPSGDRKVERFGWTFAPGDKVMQIENDYQKEVYNGDIGYIDDVDPDAGEIVVSFDGRSVSYGFGELDMLVPAYAATIHKSQGSEYSAVVIPVLTQHYAMLQRNLLYTGVTRGKRLVVLVGQKKAVAIAVRNASGRRRWSKLAEWVSGTAPKRG
jgi:ATP-dependent exoDNAse (exonuclease V) alpha subunit